MHPFQPPVYTEGVRKVRTRGKGQKIRQYGRLQTVYKTTPVIRMA